MFIPTRKSQTEITVTVQFFGRVNNTEKHGSNQYGKKENVKYPKKQKGSQGRGMY
jgi:hypothetical protein